MHLIYNYSITIFLSLAIGNNVCVMKYKYFIHFMELFCATKFVETIGVVIKMVKFSFMEIFRVFGKLYITCFIWHNWDCLKWLLHLCASMYLMLLMDPCMLFLFNSTFLFYVVDETRTLSLKCCLSISTLERVLFDILSFFSTNHS